MIQNFPIVVKIEPEPDCQVLPCVGFLRPPLQEVVPQLRLQSSPRSTSGPTTLGRPPAGSRPKSRACEQPRLNQATRRPSFGKFIRIIEEIKLPLFDFNKIFV